MDAVIAWPREPKAFLIAVPVVGGTGGQQLGLWRHLLHAGVAIGSFTYRGHRGSDGMFTFDSTISDTTAVIEALRSRVADSGLPLHLLAASYATLPMLVNLTDHPEWGVRSFVVFSGFPRMADFLEPMDEYFTLYARAFGHGHTAQDLVLAAQTDPSSVDMTALVGGYLQFFGERLPNVTITLDRFEVLEFRRADLIGEIQSYDQGRLSRTTVLRTDVPSLWIYGRRDNVLAVLDGETRRRYCGRVRRVAPSAELCEVDIDHWTRGPDHSRALQRASTFIRRHSV